MYKSTKIKKKKVFSLFSIILTFFKKHKRQSRKIVSIKENELSEQRRERTAETEEGKRDIDEGSSKGNSG